MPSHPPHLTNVHFTFYEIPGSQNHASLESPIYIVRDNPVTLALDKNREIAVVDIQSTLCYLLRKEGVTVDATQLHIFPLSGKDPDKECLRALKKTTECRDYYVIYRESV